MGKRGRKQKGKEKNNQKQKVKTPSIVESSDSEVEEKGPGRRGTRDKSDVSARIRATLREDSLSDEDRFGDRVPYRKKGWKPLVKIPQIIKPNQEKRQMRKLKHLLKKGSEKKKEKRGMKVEMRTMMGMNKIDKKGLIYWKKKE